MHDTEFDVEAILAQLTIWEKIQLLAGSSWCYTVPIPRLKVPSIKLCDGPNGVRGEYFFNGTPSNCFPCATGLAASFDVDLGRRIGEALGDESKAKKAHVLLGPTVNTQRSPLGGRGFESFSEDPHLNGRMAAAYIKGLQSTGIAATIKHYVCNDQETDRTFVSSEVNERALREVYLKPFQIAIKHAHPWAVMTSYGRVNGVHASENKRLLEGILRKEWRYDGTVISDWSGLYSSFEGIMAGLDLEMPGPTVLRGMLLQIGLSSDKLSLHGDIDPRVRQVLKLVKRGIESKVPFKCPEEQVETHEQKDLMRRAAADAIVLLKNDHKLLPLPVKAHKKIAVIGPNASIAMTSGGGSARLLVSYAVSPLKGIQDAAKHAEVEYAAGSTTYKALPLVEPYITYDGQPGAFVQFWNKEPTGDRQDFISLHSDLEAELIDPKWTVNTPSSDLNIQDHVDPSVTYNCWLRYSAIFTPDHSGEWEFSLSVVGRANLFVNNELVIDLSTDPPFGGTFFGVGTRDVKGSIKDLKAGFEYNLEIRLENVDPAERGFLFHRWGGIRLGAVLKVDPQEELDKAVELASHSDVVILVIGLNNDYESEGFDRPDMDLPGNTNELVRRILKVKKEHTVIVNQSGTPVAMPWIKDAHTLVQAFYGGNELGNALADVLFGKVNPSGKLPLTFPRRVEDTPPFPSYGCRLKDPDTEYPEYVSRSEELGKVLYNEGIYVGYRSYEIRQIKPLFEFGFGLSYTEFKYSNLRTSNKISVKGEFNITVTVENTGNIEGREIVQVYVSDDVASLPRPVKEFKGFKKVEVNPGENVDVIIDLDREALGFYDDRAKHWIAEKGVFTVHVGPSSDPHKLLSATITLEEDITWTGL